MSDTGAWGVGRRRVAASLVMWVLSAWLATASALPALAHGGDSDQAPILVLQAVGIIVNKPDEMDEIHDKINDALNAPRQEGIDLTKVREARAAVDRGSMIEARTLLQQSLQGVPMEAATGGETGTTVVHDPLNLRGQFAGQDWVLLAISALALLLGVWLAVRYRPHESVRVLRRRLATPPASDAIRRQGE